MYYAMMKSRALETRSRDRWSKTKDGRKRTENEGSDINNAAEST
jgi:hypothetical protein